MFLFPLKLFYVNYFLKIVHLLLLTFYWIKYIYTNSVGSDID